MHRTTAGVLALCFAIGLLFSACSAHTYHPLGEVIVPPEERPRPVVENGFGLAAHPGGAFDLLPVELDGSAARRAERQGYERYELRGLSVGDNGQRGNLVTAQYYRRLRQGPRPLLVVLPIYGHSEFPPRQIVKYLLAHRDDLDLLRVEGPDDILDVDRVGGAPTEDAFFEEIGHFVERVETTVVDLRRVIAWARQRDDVDAARIGIIGFSSSALLGSMVMGVEPDLAAGVFVVGGAHLHQIFPACGGDVQTVRDQILARFGWSREHYGELLERPFRPIDPARYVGEIDPHRVLLLDSAKDRCIPPPARRSFYQALGYPERLSFYRSHRNTFINMTFLGGYILQRRIHHFLEEVL